MLLRVNHSDDEQFIVNIHALHNSIRLRRAILPELHSRKSLVLDKDAIFDTAVKKMTLNRAEKTRIAAAKRAAKAMVEEAVASTGNAVASEVPTEPATATVAQSRKRKKSTTSSNANSHVTHKRRYVIDCVHVERMSRLI
jgi:hypothetical protein